MGKKCQGMRYNNQVLLSRRDKEQYPPESYTLLNLNVLILVFLNR